ncbi:universal stress protein [Ferruginibacter lapsinanis]|uniref:universal stress protein n=1 Tax=Ferruginibacter lapsinanis TaxID=563172 RepID=UPI001E3C53F3|nr:universal stress protein [Ferruginibacter lapsinanis]UEG49441.1 universal stress protein [Ferruginibacter lapsinanis]
MKTIIAPVDFSPQSLNAAFFAADLAEFYGADLILFHTYEVITPMTVYTYPFVSLPEMQHAAEYELEECKKKIDSRLKRAIHIELRTEYNSLEVGLKNLCDEKKPDLVVMGLSGKDVLTRLVVGSNTIRAIHHLDYPILAVPTKAEFIPIRKIGFACDYKQVEDTTPIEPLKKLILDFKAELHVMNVDNTSQSRTSEERALENGYAVELLKAFKPEFHAIESPDVTDGINWFAQKAKLDLIVVIPKKHNLIDKLFKRSQTKDLIFHTNIPVLCMHE